MGFMLEKKRIGGGVVETAVTPSRQPALAREKSADMRRDTVKLSFCLRRELHTRLKLEAVRRGDTIVAMVSRWLSETMPAV